MSLFGNTFKSTNVDIGAIFCGVVAAILILRRTLKAVETTGSIKK